MRPADASRHPRHRPSRRRPRAGWGGAAVVLLALVLASAQTAKRESIVHTWQRVFYAPLDGHQTLLFLDRFERAKPALGDIDGDGDPDLFVGTASGQILYFENQGTAKAPRWHLANPAIPAQMSQGADAPFAPIAVGANAAPALVDIDGDGDLDLFVGSASGRLAFFRNEGNRFLPTFRQVTTDYLGEKLGLNIVPSFADINGDGLPDLSFGNEAGAYFYALNGGTRAAPRYCVRTEPGPDCLAPLVKLGQLDAEDNAVPVWHDWDRDGDLDLFVGKSDGTIAYYENIGTRREGAWELRERRFYILDSGGFAAPAFADVNGDGADDLLLAGDGERIAFYARRPADRESPLWLEDRNVLQVRRLGGVQSGLHVAAGALHGDGRRDLVVGTRGGDLYVYENVGTPQAPAFRSPAGPLLPTSQRAFAAPTLADVDGDGDLDLIVGGREGRLEWIENTGTPQAPRWSTRSLYFGRVDVGSLSVPRFSDLDGDGDLDLLVGNSLGNVALYENVGTAQAPAFVLRTLRFAGIRVPNNAAPALFRWDPKGPPDLVLGSQAGTLIPAVRDPAIAVADRSAFRREQAWGGGLRTSANSAPLFADLNGDQRPDLLLGTGDGALLFWRNEGSAPASQLAKARRPRGANLVVQPPALTSASGLGAGAPGAGGGQQGAMSPAELPLEPIFVYEASPLETLKLGRGTKPAFFDADGDGRPDLVVGTAAGKLYLLHNGGERRNPTWSIASDAFAGYSGQRYAAPAFADVNGDGDLDLAVGNERGQVLLWENTGTTAKPQFTPRSDVFSLVRAGRNAVPAFLDVNEDGHLDLLVGNLRGELLYYEHKAGQRFDLAILRFLGLNVGVNASPTVASLTRRALPFLAVGSDQGAIRIFATTGTSRLRSSGWREVRSYLEGLKFPPGSHPAFADVDGDGDVDMVVGSDKGPLRFYRNEAIQPETAPAAPAAPRTR